MPALPFSPVDLAPAFPDVAWAIGIALMLAVYSINVIGDWLRDYLDPRLVD